jgi:membrane protein required for colicin V production
MNWLDIVLVLLFAVGLVGGYRQGLLRQVMSLATVACGLILGTYLHVPLAAFFNFTFPGTETATTDTAGFLLAVVVLVVALEVLHRRTVPETRLLAIGVLDRIAGLLVAVLAVILQLSIVVLILRFLVSAPWLVGETFRLIMVRGMKGSILAHGLHTLVVVLVTVVGGLLPEGRPRFVKLG